MTPTADPSLSITAEGPLIGQSIQVPTNDVSDDTSVLDMSWHNPASNTYTKSIMSSAINVPATGDRLPTSVSACHLNRNRQKQSNSNLDTFRSEPRLARRSRLRRSTGSAFNDTKDDAELSKLAELAAINAFGEAVTAQDGMVRRKSTLVSNDSSIDVSWFASRGLMSRKSFEKYKKEMKQAKRRVTVANADGTPKYLSKSVRKNEEYDLKNMAPPPFLSAVVGKEMLKRASFRKNENVQDKPVLKRSPVNRSHSLDNGMNNLVRTFISALTSKDEDNDGDKKLSMLKTKLSDSLNGGSANHGGLNKDELEILTKMMIRLTKDGSSEESTTKQAHDNTGLTQDSDLIQAHSLLTQDSDLIQAHSLEDDCSLQLNDLISDSNKPVHPSVSSDTMKIGTAKSRNGANKPSSPDQTPTFVTKYSYAPKRMLCKDRTPSMDLNTSDSSNMALSRTSDGTSVAVTSISKDKGELLDTPYDMKTRLPQPLIDNNDSLTSMQPLAQNSDMDWSTISGVVRAEEKVDTKDRNGTPPRRASFARDTDAFPTKRSSGSLTADYELLEGPAQKENCGDVLAEGMEYLSMAMLINIYGKLREMSILGHASVKFVDVDVNSHQRTSRLKEMKRRGVLTDEEANKGYLETTKTAEFVVRTILDEYEMFEASNELSPLMQSNQTNMQYDASLLEEFKVWVEESRVKQLDSVTEEVIKKLRDESSRREAAAQQRASYGSLCSELENARSGRSPAQSRNSPKAKSEAFQAGSWVSQERKLIEEQFEGNSIEDKGLTSSLIEKTIQQSSSDYFEQGSVMKSLLETSIEVVWFSDRHPNDIIYCICVNRQTNTVTVLFRAREGFFSTVNNSSMTDYQNPISHEDYPGNAESIRLRSKVADELLRARRDTKKSVVEEIGEKVEKIGYELDPTGNWHATVAGHGLAGGMATVLGYFLASDSSFVAASAVRVFSFAASPVGCKDFQSSFRHLEKTGRILLARFTNSHDLSFFPSWALDENWKYNCWYKDVGIHIRLHKSNYAGRERTKQALDVTYSTDMKDIGALTECINLTLNVISSFKSLVRGGWSKNARISEYQSRMHFAREYRLALGGGVFRFDMKRKNLKTLNDYYLMKCRRTDNFAGFKKQKDAMPLMLVFFVVSCLIAFEVALLFRFVSGW